jgi:hypothetical protein
MTKDPVKVPTRPLRPNMTETLRELKVGDTYRYPIGTNYGSIRTIATGIGIKIILRQLDNGDIEVTRRK